MKEVKSTDTVSMIAGVDRLVLTKKNGGLFIDDENGGYFQISYQNRDANEGSFLKQPRVIFFDENNQVVGYDGSTFGVCGALGETKSYYCAYTASCGFYAKGNCL